MLNEWWIWAAAAVVLGIGEILLPSYILLGFGIGAGALSLMLLAGDPLASIVGGTTPMLLLSFAVLSLIAWLVLRRTLGNRSNQVKTFDHDINDG